MTVWGIADLHLSFARPARRERFAARWLDHAEKIASEWQAVVRPEDLVLLPGDLSMAANHRDLQPDLAWLDRLPGTKVLAPGNHDRWWNNIDAIRPMLRRTLLAVSGDAIQTHGVVVCGTRGAPPYHETPSPQQDAVSNRELAMLDSALDAAGLIREGDQPLYVLWHYPPFDLRRRAGLCVARFEEARVTSCVYGHLHAEGQWSSAVQGMVGRVKYHCVAADAIGFRPIRLSPKEGSSVTR
jgi:predicted phosphohydrolase